MTTTSRITLRAAYDSNARYIHDEIKCDSMDQPEAQDFIARYSDNYLVIVYDRGDVKNDYNPTWKGVRLNCITNIPNDKWIYQALVFGHSLEKIDPTLTIEMTPEQVQGVNDLPGYYARPAYYKDIAGEELTNKYKMWHLFCERPKWEAGKVERTNYKHISTPPEKQYKASYSDVVEDNINDTWRREIAMEAGMLHGCNAYNEAMGY